MRMTRTDNYRIEGREVQVKKKDQKDGKRRKKKSLEWVLLFPFYFVLVLPYTTLPEREETHGGIHL